MNKSNTNIIIFSALLLIISVSFLAGLILGFNTGNRSRYQIINANNIVILLDSYTGLTWRNVSSYNNIPNEWQEMKMIVGDANEAKKMNVPIGKDQDRKNFIKQEETKHLKELNKLIDNRKKLNYKEFARIIKERYPAYSDLSDKDLIEKILHKYPELKAKIEMN